MLKGLHPTTSIWLICTRFAGGVVSSLQGRASLLIVNHWSQPPGPPVDCKLYGTYHTSSIPCYRYGTWHIMKKLKKRMPQRILKIRFKIIAQKVMRKIANLPSITIIFLKERERVLARPVSKQTRTTRPNNQRQVLKNGVISSFYSKRSLDSAMFLKCLRTLHRWDNGVST